MPTGATHTESNSNDAGWNFAMQINTKESAVAFSGRKQVHSHTSAKHETLTVHFAAYDHRLEPIELSDIKVDRRVAQKDVARQLQTSFSGKIPKK